VEKYRSGLGYKKISDTLNIPLITIKLISKKLKEYGTATNMPRAGHPPKLTYQARRALTREATKRPKITLKELQNSTAEIGVSVHRTTLSCTESPKKGMWETPRTWKVLWSDETKIELFGHQGKCYV
jgi:transposase